MKMFKTMSALALGLTVATVAQAQTVYISGSTAFRSQVYQGLTDLGLTNQPGDSSSANTFTFAGTVNANTVKPANFPLAAFSGGLPSGFVGENWTVYCSFDGSLQGVDNCLHSANHNTFENLGGASAGTFSHSSDLAFSDVSQSSASPTDQSPPATALNEILADDVGNSFTGIAVQPFLYGANAAAWTAGVTYIQDNQISSLLTGGVLDLCYWTGNSAQYAAPLGAPTFEPAPGPDTVVLTGRDNSSGTRITAQQLDDWPTANPINQYTINGVTTDPATLVAGDSWGWIANSGYSSGGKVADALEYPVGNKPAVGYLSFADAKTLQVGAVAGPSSSAWTNGVIAPNNGYILSYEGLNPVTTAPTGNGSASGTGNAVIVYDMAAVENGQWPMWSYEHLYEATTVVSGGAIDAQFAPGLVYALDFEIYQQGTGVHPPITALLEGSMNVYRSNDGGPIQHN
jgi:hypothetical protein